MKLVTAIIVLTLLLAASTNLAKPKTTIQIKDNTVESLIIGLNSDNLGLQSSSAYMIGELQLSEAVIPLLRILHSEKNEELRIMAALALYKIGSPIAINAVKQAIRFDDSERVSKLCANFYNDYLRNNFNDEEINVDVSKTALK
jgi:HEAT repeat protein